MKRWSVRAGDGATAGEIVRRAGGDAAAIRDGRVFVGARRVRDESEPVRVDDVVQIAEAPAARVEIAILGERGGLVAVDKPAGISTIPDHAGASDALRARVARAIGAPEAELHATSRLDRQVSGVVVFARTKDAAERLVRARREGAYERRYVAIASRAPDAEEGEWNVPIGRARDPRHRQANGKDATHAETRYRTIALAGGAALLALRPITGRTHQLRVHASFARAPLLGDRVYGGPARVTLASGRVLSIGRIALHAARVTVPDASGAPWRVSSPIPPALADAWLALGGEASAWDTALACPLDVP